MKRQHDWFLWLICLCLALVLLSAARLATDIGRPFGGYLTSYNVMRNSMSIVRETPPWWSGMAPDRLRDRGSLRQINGLPYNAVNERSEYAAAFAQGQSAVTLVIERDGEMLDVVMPIIPFSLTHFIDIKAPGLLVSLGLWLVAFVIYRAQPAVLLNRVTAALLCTLAIYTGVTLFNLYWHEGFVAKLLDLATIVAASFTGLLLLHFALLFPRSLRPMPRPIRLALALLYLVATGMALAYVASRLMLWSNGLTPLVQKLDGYAFYFNWRMTGVGAVAVLLRFAWLSFYPRYSRRERREARILLLGLAIALPVIGVAVRNALVTSGYLSFFWQHLDTRYFFLAVPIAVAAIILRYQTFHRPSPLFLLVPILGLSGLFASLGSALIVTTQPATVTAVLPPFIPFFLLIFAASLLWSTQTTWQGWFGRLLHWEQRSYATARQFGQQLIAQNQPQELPQRIALLLCADFKLERAAVYLWEAAAETYQLAGQSGSWTEPPAPNLPAVLPPGAAPLRLETVAAARLRPFLPQIPLTLAVPLAVAEQPVGLLLLGPRWDEAIFDERDLEILDLVGQQATLFILTAQQIAQLRRVPEQISQAQERERFKLAQELHDTTQQFLGRLPFALECSRDAIVTDPPQAADLLEQCLDETEREARTLRQIRHNMAPTQLQLRLEKWVNDLADHFHYRTGVTVKLHIPPDLPQPADLEARRALYRVMQQALDNVAEHAQATEVVVTLGEENGRLHFRIQDNGHGFTPAQRQQAEKQGSFGLQSMTARVQSLGGQLSIESGPEQGTAVTGWIP